MDLQLPSLPQSPAVTGRLHFPRWFIGFAIVFFALITLAAQEQALGLPYIEGVQLQRHYAVLNDTAKNPWNYRVFSEWVLEPVLRASAALRLPRSVSCAFLFVRAVQNLLIFFIAWVFYRSCGLSQQRSLLGLIILSSTFTQVFYNADLSVNTYFDLLFFLVAGWLIVREKYEWIVPISVMAALNRETGIYIPVMAASSLLFVDGRRQKGAKRQAIAAMIGACLFVGVFVALRLTLHKSAGWQSDWGNQPGLQTLLMNFKDIRGVIIGVALTLSVLPLLALVRFRSLPRLFQAWYLLMVPFWIAIHFIMVYANETRYYLVPIALVLIPAAIWPMSVKETVEAEGLRRDREEALSERETTLIG